MNTDLADYRIITDASQTNPSSQDWFQETANNNSTVVADITQALTENGITPENTEDFLQLVINLTTAAVSYAGDILPDGGALPDSSTLQYVKLLGPAGDIITLPFGTAISAAAGQTVERAFAEAVIDLIGGRLATAGLAAIGVGTGSLVVSFVAGWAVTEILQQQIDYYITPEVKQGVNPETGIYEVVTRLELDEYLRMYWDDYFGDTRLGRGSGVGPGHGTLTTN